MSQKRKIDPIQAKNVQDLKKWLATSRRVLISTHLLPDGDGLGAETALYHYLHRAKKAVRVCNPDPVPPRYQFLDRSSKFLKTAQDYPKPWKEADLWIILDTNDPRRLGPLWDHWSPRVRRIVFLDHHSDQIGGREVQYPPHATLVSEDRASSIGELLYRIFQKLRLTKIDSKIGLGLYVSVMTDTNSFRYARTTPLAHQIAAEMIQLGVNPEDTYQAIFSSKQVSHVQLLGALLQNVQVRSQGKIAWMELDLNLRRKYQAAADDTLSFLNLLLLLKDAEIIILFREEDDRRIRVSLKSKGKIIINRLAVELGGGGHDYAAGLSLNLNMKETVSKVIGRVEALIDQEKYPALRRKQV